MTLELGHAAEPVGDDVGRHPEFLGELADIPGPLQCRREPVERNEPTGGLDPNGPLNRVRLAAVVVPVEVHEFVREGAAALCLLLASMEPDRASPVGAPTGAVGHVDPGQTDVVKLAENEPGIELPRIRKHVRKGRGSAPGDQVRGVLL